MTASTSFIQLLGQAASPSSEAAAAVQINTIWDFVVKGGPVMIPIGIASLVALAVVIERLVMLRRSKIIPAGFMEGLKAAFGRGNRAAGLDYCRTSASPIANIFAAAIKRLGEPTEQLEKHVEEAGQREVFKLRKYLRLLSVIASVSTLLGLLGTILGMINAFQTVAASGEALGKTELLAKGIYEALITTAAGLMVSIPVLIAYHGFAGRIDRLVGEIDLMTVEFIEEFAHPAPAETGRAMSAAPAGSPSTGSSAGQAIHPQALPENASIPSQAVPAIAGA